MEKISPLLHLHRSSDTLKLRWLDLTTVPWPFLQIDLVPSFYPSKIPNNYCGVLLFSYINGPCSFLGR